MAYCLGKWLSGSFHDLLTVMSPTLMVLYLAYYRVAWPAGAACGWTNGVIHDLRMWHIACQQVWAYMWAMWRTVSLHGQLAVYLAYWHDTLPPGGLCGMLGGYVAYLQAMQATGWLHGILKDSVAYWLGMSPTGMAMTYFHSMWATGIVSGFWRGIQPIGKAGGSVHDL